jgi:hypothetical protein
MQAVNDSELESRSSDSTAPEPLSISNSETNFRDEERGLSSQVPLLVRSPSNGGRSSTAVGEDTEPNPSSLAASTGGYLRQKASNLLDAVSLSSHKGDRSITAKLASLVDAYAGSDIALGIRQEIETMRSAATENGNAVAYGGETRDVVIENSLLRGRKRASWGMQFKILSGRAFKNLYRDPALLAAHYISSIVLACEYLGFWFRIFLICFSVVRSILSQCFVGILVKLIVLNSFSFQ